MRKKWFWRWNLFTVKIVEMTTKDFKYYLSLVAKEVSGFERTDSNFGRGSTVAKMLSNEKPNNSRDFLY